MGVSLEHAVGVLLSFGAEWNVAGCRLGGQMLNQKTLIEGGIVMVVVTACGGAGFKTKTPMTRTHLADVLVAMVAIIIGKGYSHGPSHFRSMLAVAGDAVGGVKLFQPASVSRVGEFAFRMSIVSGFELLAVAVNAGRFFNAHERGVTRLASEFDLVMAGRRLARKEQGWIRAAEAMEQVGAHAGEQGQPDTPGK